MSWSANLQREYYRNGYKLFLNDGNKVLSGISLVKVEEGSCIDGISVETDMLQALATELWVAGFRPIGYKNVNESMLATNKHLEDFRAIVFDKLKVPKPDGS